MPRLTADEMKAFEADLEAFIVGRLGDDAETLIYIKTDTQMMMLNRGTVGARLGWILTTLISNFAQTRGDGTAKVVKQEASDGAAR